MAQQPAGWGLSPADVLVVRSTVQKRLLPTHTENKRFSTFLLEPTGILPLTEGVGASSPYPPKEESGAGRTVTA